MRARGDEYGYLPQAEGRGTETALDDAIAGINGFIASNWEKVADDDRRLASSYPAQGPLDDEYVLMTVRDFVDSMNVEVESPWAVDRLYEAGDHAADIVNRKWEGPGTYEMLPGDDDMGAIDTPMEYMTPHELFYDVWECLQYDENPQGFMVEKLS